MSNIKFKTIRFRNFLSYGDSWQEISLIDGITIIKGNDINTLRSNGSGKSSCLETIPFALFGQTIKPIKKTDIVNWFNGSGCMVELTVEKDGFEYIFKRGIKPNKFDVYKDMVKIPKLSTVKLYQSLIEEEILGMDFKTFKSLVYFSPNNTISLLEAKKEQKRQFLESLFDLSVYSKINNKVNKKIGVINTDLVEMAKDVDNNNTLIESHQKDIDGSVIPNIKAYQKDLNFLKLKLSALEDNPVVYDPIPHNNTKSITEGLKDDLMGIVSQCQKHEMSIITLTTKIDGIDTKKTKEQKDAIDKDLSLFDKDGLVVELTELKEKKEMIIERIDDLKSFRDEHDLIGGTVNDEITSIKTKMSLIEDEINDLSYEDMDTCPTCKQSVDHVLLKEWYTDKLRSLDERMYALNGTLDEKIEKMVAIDKCITETDENIYALKGSLERVIKRLSCIKDDLQKIIHLTKSKDLLPDITKSDLLVKGWTDELTKNKSSLSDLKWKKDLIEQDLELSGTSLLDFDEKKKLFTDYNDDIKSIKNKIVDKEQVIKEFKVIIKQQEDIIKEKKLLIENLHLTNISIEKSVSSKNTMKDHLLFIKTSLSDENIKRYAISSVLPYLNKRSNFYLSESGIPYIIDIDGWLDVTIKSLGVKEISYGALSGGEIKSINLSIQLACNDIAALQSDTTLGISFFDEMIDGSLDDIGVELLMNIIKTRQESTDDCVMVVTHRKELKNIEYNGILTIEKENGFSKIGGM